MLMFSFRYWNDEEVLRKLGQAMGLAVTGDAAASSEHSGPDETEEVGNEDESIVHQTASVGDVEVRHSNIVQFTSFQIEIINSYVMVDNK